jgi:hypothetical protein
MKINLGCGLNKKDGFINVDLIENADIQQDMYDYLVTLQNNSVDEIYSYHSLEHLTKEQFLKVFNEILRVSKHGAKISIGVPYYSQSVNITNPYHHMFFNEHTFRFFCREKNDRYNVLKKSSWIRDYSFGMWNSANEGQLFGYVLIKKIKYIYTSEFADKSDIEKEYARLHLNNIVLEINIEMEVEK